MTLRVFVLWCVGARQPMRSVIVAPFIIAMACSNHAHPVEPTGEEGRCLSISNRLPPQNAWRNRWPTNQGEARIAALARELASRDT
jgi:hypothetical protein